jgi:RNA polymerase sigma-70 factor (ECF subfamily)
MESLSESSVTPREPGGSWETGPALECLRARVTRAVRRACPAWLANQADDIVQSVFLQLVITLRKSEGNQTFSSIYLEKAAYGAVVDEIRRQCRRKEYAMPQEEGAETTVWAGAGPDRRASSVEIARGIHDCLARLIRPRRLAVTLYLQGCTVPETARRLRWSPKRADNLVYRGLADLRTCLQGKGLEP